MINTWAYDVEILPNFFSIVFIDVNDYLKVFNDACNIKIKKDKEIREPIPLIQKYTVEEIKNKLDKVRKYKFYITDKDDSQLLQMLGFINNLRAHFKIENDKKIPIRNDIFGYNSNNYDKFMIAALLMFANQVNNTKELITKLYETSKKIIDLQNSPEVARSDYFLTSLKKYPLPFKNVDVMTIFALNKVGSGIDKNGEKVYFPKSLKQTSINLQWYELLEHELPPISDKDIGCYTKINLYKDLTCNELNNLIDKWDRYIIDEWIDPIMHYNENDVFIVCEMIRLYIDEIRLRYNISKSYGIDVLSSSRSNIADNMFIKFYSEFSGLSEKQWRGRKTERTALNLKKIIFPWINFKTKDCQELLDDMKKVILYSIGKKAIKDVSDKYVNLKHLKTDLKTGWFEVTINNLTYTIATGGLHSKDLPRVLKSKIHYIDETNINKNIWENITDDSYIYVHWDISSFYPSIMDAHRVSPAHINEGVFVKLIHWIKETRLEAKHSDKEYIDGISTDLLARLLKIVINAIYGKMGFEHGDICDRLAVLKVTINGQLMIIMLCEELELNGIEVMSANTDGIVVKLYKKDKELFETISSNWKNLTKLEADSEDYKIYVNRDINNYFVQELNDKITYKGSFNPLMYSVELGKGYDMPIVAQSVVNYFLYNKPILETLYECTNILDFCKTQNIAKKFRLEYTKDNTTNIIQSNTRFYVSNQGGILEKVEKDTKYKSNLCAGYKVIVLNTLDDQRIEYRNINYNYYYKEALKIIDPIKLSISPKRKVDKQKGISSGKSAIKKYSGMYNTLFDDNDE